MSRWRESSGRSSGSQIVPPGESSSSNTCESFTRFSKSAILASRRTSPSRMNGQPYTGANAMLSPPIVSDLAGLRACSSNWLGALATCSRIELGVEADAVLVLDGLAGGAQQLDGLGQEELDSDLGDDPAPAAVEHLERVLAEDLVTGH